jgi:hypothetical protein
MIRNKFVAKYSTSLVKQVTGFLTNAVIEGKLKGGERLGEPNFNEDLELVVVPFGNHFEFLKRMDCLSRSLGRVHLFERLQAINSYPFGNQKVRRIYEGGSGRVHEGNLYLDNKVIDAIHKGFHIAFGL